MNPFLILIFLPVGCLFPPSEALSFLRYVPANQRRHWIIEKEDIDLIKQFLGKDWQQLLRRDFVKRGGARSMFDRFMSLVTGRQHSQGAGDHHNNQQQQLVPRKQRNCFFSPMNCRFLLWDTDNDGIMSILIDGDQLPIGSEDEYPQKSRRALNTLRWVRRRK